MNIELFDIPIFAGSKTSLLNKCTQFLSEEKPHLLISINPEIIMQGERDANFKKILKSADINFADGIGILWGAGAKGPMGGVIRLFWGLFSKKVFRSPIKEQIRGREFIFDLARLAQKKDLTLYLVGGRGVASKAAEKIKKEISPNLKILAEDGPVNWQLGDKEDRELVKRIARIKPAILLSAFGAPKDQLFLFHHKNDFGAKILLGVGGTFDYLAGKQKLPPRFIASLGFEWLWRLLHEPKRFKRQLALPLFVFKVLFQSKKRTLLL